MSRRGEGKNMMVAGEEGGEERKVVETLPDRPVRRLL